MTLLDEILAGGFDLSNRNDGEIAAALSAGRVKVISRHGGIGVILDTLGPDAGGQFLDALEELAPVNSAVKWGLKLIERGELDFGAPATRAMIKQLVPLQVAQDALLGVAMVPDVITAQDVAKALEGM